MVHCVQHILILNQFFFEQIICLILKHIVVDRTLNAI